jgi:hypothetical protein
MLSGYKEYPGGIWFPSHVRIVYPSLSIDLFLVHAAFNRDARLDELKRWIPIGTQVSDGRLGQTVTYRYSGSVPNLARLQVLLRQQAAATDPEKPPVAATLFLALGPLAGVLLLRLPWHRRERMGGPPGGEPAGTGVDQGVQETG